MTATVTIIGIKEALRAFDQLPKRVRRKHLSIALNAGGGVIKNRAQALARRESGLLSKSIAVKVPSQAKLEKEGRPAHAVIGPKRRSGRMIRLNRKGNLKGFGAAQRALVAERKRLKADGTLPPLRRERAAVKATLQRHSDAIYRNPVRYAHLVEKGHAKGKGRSAAKPYPFLGPAVTQTAGQALGRVREKLQQGIEQEARALAR